MATWRHEPGFPAFASVSREGHTLYLTEHPECEPGALTYLYVGDVDAWDAAFRAGLLCYPGGGTADGESGDHVLLAPPYNVESHHLDELVEKLDGALTSALTRVPTRA